MFLVHLALAADPCAGIDPCTVLERTPVGKDREVVHVAYMKKADVPTNVGEPLYGEPGACNRHAWWMVDGAKTRPILEVCNDGYGASGVGEDDVSVKDGVFTHSQYGGSAWRWTNSRSIALFPPAWVASSGYNHYMGLIGMGSEWDYKAGRGRFTETFTRCGQDEEQVDVSGPVLPVLPEIEGYSWNTTALGACAVAVDASTVEAVVHGKPGAATDGALKAAFIGDALVVEVRDDTWVPTAKSWIKADHLEIWTSSVSRFEPECVSKRAAQQWGIGLDGTVYPAFGEPAPLAVQVSREEAVWRVRITGVAPDVNGITVVYSDSDDGAGQERLIATSPVKLGHGETLGVASKVDHATCVMGPGGLTWKLRDLPADGPLLPAFP